MSKSKVILTLTGFVLAAAIAYPAEAQPKPKGQCKGDWDRVKVWDARCKKEARKIDRHGNDDDFVCEKYKYGSIKYRDNDYDDDDYDDDDDDYDDDDDDYDDEDDNHDDEDDNHDDEDDNHNH